VDIPAMIKEYEKLIQGAAGKQKKGGKAAGGAAAQSWGGTPTNLARAPLSLCSLCSGTFFFFFFFFFFFLNNLITKSCLAAVDALPLGGSPSVCSAMTGQKECHEVFAAVSGSYQKWCEELTKRGVGPSPAIFPLHKAAICANMCKSK
jgi:hypothetical protein